MHSIAICDDEPVCNEDYHTGPEQATCEDVPLS